MEKARIRNRETHGAARADSEKNQAQLEACENKRQQSREFARQKFGYLLTEEEKTDEQKAAYQKILQKRQEKVRTHEDITEDSEELSYVSNTLMSLGQGYQPNVVPEI